MSTAAAPRAPAPPARPEPSVGRLDGWLAARWTPLVFGAISALMMAWAWGTLRALPALYDEVSYLLQARLFSQGRWRADPLPFPEFMEQFHVLVTPYVASKYMPGHAAALAPGMLLGLPGLMPVLLSGVAGALVFALARRVTDPWTALVAWLLWIAAPDNLRWRTSYFSETTTSAAILGAWWFLHSWRRTHRTPALLGVALLFGVCAITRPLTALAFAVPVGVFVLWRTVARRAWVPLLQAIAAGTLCLAVIPLWSARTTGDWRVSPHALYTRQYMPWDRPGLGFDPTPPSREIPTEMQGAIGHFGVIHRVHTAEALPDAALQRAIAILRGTFLGVGLPAIAFLLAGLWVSREGRFAAASWLAVLLAYLSYAHPPRWTLYYLETLPVLAFLAAAGFVAATRLLGTKARLAAPLAVVLVGWLVLLPLPTTVRMVRGHAESGQSYAGWIAASLAGIPAGERALVFFRFAPGHVPHNVSLAQMDDPARTRVLVVRDRGPDNARLIRALPDRRPYIFDEAAGSVTPLH